MTTNSSWAIRDAQEGDLNFIYSTWGNSYRYDSPLGKACKNSIFFPNFNRTIDGILHRTNTRVAVACDPDEIGVIYGYVVHEKPDILHYAFTKEAFFNFGIAKSLVLHLGGAQFYSFKTMSVSAIVKKHPELIFNPFLAFKPDEEISHDFI